MKKISIFLLLLSCYCFSFAGFYKVSTATNGSGAYVTPTNLDANGWLVSASGGSSVTFPTYSVPAFGSFWQPVPVAGTNAGWINPTPTTGGNQAGIYTFERKFKIASCVASFTTNFQVTADDALNSLELVDPIGFATPLTVVPTTPYHLSVPITYTQNCPRAGTWTIRAKVWYVDALGSFMLSGNINYADPKCCDTTCKLTVLVPKVSTVPFSCGSTINLKCDTKYSFSKTLTCQGVCPPPTAVKYVTLKDPSNTTPVWASSFIAALGSGSLSIPAGIPSGAYTLTYFYGVSNNQICDSCKIILNITCKPCDCILTTTIKAGNITTSPKCGDTTTVTCGVTMNVNRSLNCGANGNVHLNNVSLTDALGNTPTWFTALFQTNLGAGSLVIPPTVSGVFALKYVWGENCQKCDSCTYYIKVNCCSAFKANAGPDIQTCCGPVQLGVTLTGGTPAYSYLWTPSASVSNPSISNPTTTISGSYTVVVTDASGCRSVDTVNVLIVPTVPSCCRQSKQLTSATKTAIEVNEVNDIKVIPNPFKNGFTIESSKTTTGIEIMDAEGKTLNRYTNVSYSKVLGKELPAGAYMLLVHFKDGSSKTIKVIKN